MRKYYCILEGKVRFGEIRIGRSLQHQHARLGFGWDSYTTDV